MISERNQQRLMALAHKVIRSRKIDKYSDPAIKSGVANMFLRITESFALKLNPDYNEALDNFYRQQRAWSIGYGPFCFGYMSITDASGKTYYCFITEVVISYKEIVGSRGSNYMEADLRVRHMIRILNKKVGFYFIDCHSDNVGVRSPKARKLLCIDFGIDR